MRTKLSSCHLYTHYGPQAPMSLTCLVSVTLNMNPLNHKASKQKDMEKIT